MKRLLFIFSFILILVLGFPSVAQADGIIIPDPPICDPGFCDPFPMEQLEIKYHHVNVMIENQVAVTHVDQVFYNPNTYEIEGTYIFPVPVDATVTNFVLWIDGEPVKGEVLEAGEARGIYEDIVRQMKDPALLEYVGQGALQASIYPIPAFGERRIEIEYSEPLTAENGLVRYVYPLNTEKFSITPLESVSVSVDIESDQDIRAVYSPTHDIAVDKLNDGHYRAGYEAMDTKPDTDFALYYSIGENEAFHMMTYRDPGDEDKSGYFLLMLAPSPQVEEKPIPKDVILVLDKSGSMDGEKFQQAQEAIVYILQHLNEDDRFNIITFSTGLEIYASALEPAAQADDAVEWVMEQEALGATDINRALLEASYLAEGNHPTYLIFLTDGLPTEGETDSARIIENIEDNAPDNLRLFSFGVGYDVDTFLLDSLAKNHHGTSTYVLPEERLDERLSEFYSSISTPVMTDLEIEVDGMTVYDLYPNPLPDLFEGSQIIVVGRYKDGGSGSITLTGKVGNERETFVYDDLYFIKDSRSRSDSEVVDTLPRLWATRKIGYLLNDVRLNGPDEETIDQIVHLSIRYGIVTPYTSYLVTEPDILGVEEQSRIVDDAFDMAEEVAAEEPAFGEAAVDKATTEGDLAGADFAPSPNDVELDGITATDVVKTVGTHTFVYQDGIWVDTLFDPDSMIALKVPFLSQDYFDLSSSRQEIGAAFALGDRVIVISDGIAYEVIAEDQTGDDVEIPAGDSSSGDADAGDEPDDLSPLLPVDQNDDIEQDTSAEKGFFSICSGFLIPLGFIAAIFFKKK
ncbi:MAG: VWA domain-containing protein [Anaerolineales bacterium]|nr:VWA domain-containing protein [Anaerolineales bacterium]